MASESGMQSSPSLLPYLQGAEARLKLSLLQNEPSRRDHAYPFKVLEDSHPAYRLIEAAFVTDAGTPLKRVVLQVQKDRYTLPAGDRRPLNNLKVEEWWQKAYRAEHAPAALDELFISAQRGAQDALIPLDPLFFCRKKELFFHPPCPSCGLPLTLCTDDTLLTSSGLGSYSGSLKRYLHCSSCCGRGIAEFYLYELEHDDPVTVKDRWTLVEGFRKLIPGMLPDHRFPCTGCHNHESCYGATRQVRSRIAPFSFYPFYLLIHDLPSLRAVDFLHLISGAPVEELAERFAMAGSPETAGSVAHLPQASLPGQPLFAPGDDRSFLEILFLKLSLLNDLLLQNRDDFSSVHLALDSLWVTLPASSPVLPSQWNFRVKIIDHSFPALSGPGRIASPLDHLARLALLWTQVLCGSSTVTGEEIHDVVSGRLGQLSRRGALSEDSGGLSAILAPENVFWQSQGRRVREEWLTLWERCCAPVQHLMKAAAGTAPSPSPDELTGLLKTLRGELKGLIFPAASAPEPEPWVRAPAEPPPAVQVAPQKEEQTEPELRPSLHAILSTLVEQARSEVERDSAPQPRPDQFYKSTETVILAPRTLPASFELPPDPIEETLIAPLCRFPEPAEPSVQPQRTAEMEPPAAKIPGPQAPEADQEVLLETILAAPSLPLQDPPAAPAEQEGDPSPAPSPAAAIPEADLLTETIYVPPDGRPRPR